MDVFPILIKNICRKMKNKQEPKAFVYKGCGVIECRKSTDGRYFFLQTPCLFVILQQDRVSFKDIVIFKDRLTD